MHPLSVVLLIIAASVVAIVLGTIFFGKAFKNVAGLENEIDPTIDTGPLIAGPARVLVQINRVRFEGTMRAAEYEHGYLFECSFPKGKLWVPKQGLRMEPTKPLIGKPQGAILKSGDHEIHVYREFIKMMHPTSRPPWV